MKNTNLNKAKKAKNDCFYTLLKDVEKEVSQYDLTGKVIYCNCDDYRYSNFVKYFKDNFEILKIKKLIATNYDMGEGAFIYEYDGINEKVRELIGNGDFRSPECIAYLQEADIVCTNPPFSLFREYIKQLMDYDKKFLVIGNSNAFTYKEIFPLIKEGKIRTGKNYVKEFKQPDGTFKKFGNICWFTNLEIHKADDPMELVEKYDPVKFPKYDNYDAINVDKVVDIPYDYNGVIGVPITIVDKVADDGFIHCIHTSEETINKTFKVDGHEHDLNDEHKSVSQLTVNVVGKFNESLSNLSVNNNEHNEWSECQLLDNDKRKVKIFENIHSEDIKFEIIGACNYSTDIFGNPWIAKINSNNIYARILIKRNENTTNSN